MANKEVKVGDDWYLGENNDGDLIFYNARKNEVVKAIDVITGAEDKKDNSLNKLLRAQLQEITTPSTPPSGYKELFTKSAGLAHILDDAGNETPLLGQAGSSTWANRSYEGYEVVDTATTYTVGSSGDYSSLYEAGQDFRNLILEANVTLQLTDITVSETTEPTFKAIYYAGGKFILDLNGNTWEYNPTNATSHEVLSFLGLGFFDIKNGTISFNPSNDPSDSGLRIISSQGNHFLRLNSNVTVNVNNNNIGAILLAYANGAHQWRGPTINNVGSVNYGELWQYQNAYGTCTVDPSTYSVGSSILVLSDGTIVSS